MCSVNPHSGRNPAAGLSRSIPLKTWRILHDVESLAATCISAMHLDQITQLTAIQFRILGKRILEIPYIPHLLLCVPSVKPNVL